MASLTHPAATGTRSAASRTVTAGRGNTFTIYLAHALSRTRRNTLIWLAALAAYGAMLVAIFPSMQDTLRQQDYPQGMMDAFSITDMGEIHNFLMGEIFSYLPLVIAFIPIMLFSGALAGAEERGSLDVLLGTPLPRRHLVLTTFIAGAVNLFVVLAGFGAGLWLTSLAVGAGLSLRSALEGALSAWPIGLAFGSIALLASAAMRQRSRVLGLTIGVLFAMYALYVVSRLVDSLAWLKWLTAFHYYGEAIVKGVYWTGAVLLLAITAALVVLAVRAFERRDIYT